jgi:flagellar hook-length control protein FliK
MQQISFFPPWMAGSASTDVVSPVPLSGAPLSKGSASDPSNGSTELLASQDFRHVFQSFKLHGTIDGQHDPGFEQWQGELAEQLNATEISGVADIEDMLESLDDFSLNAINPNVIESAQPAAQFIGMPLDEGQVIASATSVSGEALPPGLSVTTEQSANVVMDHLSVSLRDDKQTSRFTGPPVSMPASSLAPGQNPPQASFSAASAGNAGSANSAYVGTASENSSALTFGLASNTASNTTSNTTSNTITPYPEALEAPGKQGYVSTAATSTENVVGKSSMQSTDQALAAFRENYFGPGEPAPSERVARTKTPLELLSREAGLPILDEGVEIDRQERSSSALVDVRARVSDTGLRQYATSVGPNVNDPDWGETMNQKIVWLSGRRIQSAEIQLTPADLGPVDVKISVQNDQTTVTFNAHNASVRELLETNIHRLREMMSDNGVDLAEVNVGSEEQSKQFNTQHNDGYESPDRNQEMDNDEALTASKEQSEPQQVISVSTPNRVDFYA